jgi:hypothetical protein
MNIILVRAREQLPKPGAAEPNSVRLESVAFEPAGLQGVTPMAKQHDWSIGQSMRPRETD